MKIKLLLLIGSFITISILKAQDPTVNWGTQTEAGGGNNSFIALGWINGHYYVVQIDGKDGYLMNVNEKMDLESKTEMLTGGKKFEADIVFMRGDKINVIYSDYENGEKTTYVFATTFNLKGKAEGAKLKKIAGIKVNKSMEKNDLKYSFSSDTSMMVIFEEFDMRKDDPAKVAFTVLNTTNFDEVWSTSTDLPYEDGNFTALSFAVEKSGDVMLLATVKGDDGKNYARYTTRMFSFSAKSKGPDEKELKLDGKFISSASIKFVNNEKILITGFYNDLTEKGKNEGIEGAFIALADPKDLISLDLRVKKMDIITKTSIVRTGALAKFFDADELNAYVMRDIKMNPDGSGYVIAEQRYVVQDDNGNTMSRTYYFNHLILFRFDVTQEIQWISTIPKVQATTIATPKIGIGPVSFWFFTGSMIKYAYKYNSFVSTEKDGVIYVLYNDHKDNGDARSLKDVKAMTNKNKALATVAAVDPDGKWEKTQLFRGKDIDAILETSSSYPMPGTGFIISGEKGKNLQYGKIEL